MSGAYTSAGVVTLAGHDYDPISVQITKDNNWTPTYQGTVVLPLKDMVAPANLSTRTNLFTNPSAQVDLNNATSTNLASLVRQVTQGIASAHGTAFRLNGSTTQNDSWMNMGGDAGGMRNGMVAGKTYTVSGTFYADGALAGTEDPFGRARRIVLYAITPGVNGGAAYILGSSQQAPNAKAQTRLAITYTVPAGTTQIWVRFYHGHAGASAAYWTDLMLIEGQYYEADGVTPVGFVDGDIADSVIYDYSWNGPAYQSTSTRTVIFASPATTPIVDPREYPSIRVQLYAGDVAGPAKVQDVYLTVRTYAIDDVADTVTLSVMSDEIKLQDYLNVGDDYAPGAMTLADMFGFAMRKIGNQYTLFHLAVGGVVIPAAATIWQSGQSLDEWLRGAMRSQGYEVYQDATQSNHLFDTYLISNQTKEFVSTNIKAQWGMNVLECATGVDMDAPRYGDAAIVHYNWTDAAGAGHQKTYYSRPPGPYHKVITADYNSPDPASGNPADGLRAQAGWQAWTMRLLLISSIGYMMNGTSPAIPYPLTLGGQVWLRRPDGSTFAGVAGRITYSYPADTLEIGLQTVAPNPNFPPTIPTPGDPNA